MVSRRRSFIVLAFGAALVLAPAVSRSAAAQDQALKAKITVSLSVTPRNGTSHWRSRGDDPLKVGETSTYYLWGSADGNSAGASGQPPGTARPAGGVSGGVIRSRVVNGRVEITKSDEPPPPPRADYVWKIDVKPVSIAIDGITFDMDWQRTDVKDGVQQPGAGDHRTVTLRQGERQLVDLVACAPADGPNANLFIDVEAVPVEDPAFANVAFDYDVWLVHQTADGGKVTRHAMIGGRQGEQVKFGFAPIPLQLEAGTPADGASPFQLLVNGTIVGRMKADGTIEIALQSDREQVNASRGGLGFGGGVKVFVVKPGETTSIALPSGSGRSSWKSDRSLVSPRPGVSMSGDSVVIDLKPFFEGTTTSIVLTVTRAR